MENKETVTDAINDIMENELKDLPPEAKAAMDYAIKLFMIAI